MVSRRRFLGLAAAGATFPRPGWTRLLAQGVASGPTRLNVAEIDRARILAGAARAVSHPAVANGDLSSESFLAFTLQVPALAAASLVQPAQAAGYGSAAAGLLESWILKKTTRATLQLEDEKYEALIDLLGLAEIAVSLPLLTLDDALRARLMVYFATYLKFLTEDRTALLARDAKDHHGSAWLLQVSALARLLKDETLLTSASHRFKSVAIRAQIESSGAFPHELTTENSYRNSLFNLDLLAGVCVLLSTRFDSIWEHELQDGPGMRTAMAHHVPYIRDRKTWPYKADLERFNELPGRRPALLFAARAYGQAEYAALWRTLDPDPADPIILRTFPIRQPLLWQSLMPRMT